MKWSESCSVTSDSLRPLGLYSPWSSPAQNTGVGSLSLLQGIFPTQGLNPGLLHCRRILYQLSHKGNPRILEWVAYPFSRGSSWPRNWTGVSCIAVGFFTNWAMKGSPELCSRFSLVIYFIDSINCVYMSNPNLPIHPSSFYPPWVYTFVLYVCVSISVLQMRSSVPFF